MTVTAEFCCLWLNFVDSIFTKKNKVSKAIPWPTMLRIL